MQRRLGLALIALVSSGCDTLHKRTLVLSVDRVQAEAFFRDYLSTNGYVVSRDADDVVARARQRPLLLMHSADTNVSISATMIGGWRAPANYQFQCNSLKDAAVATFGTDRVHESK